MSKEIVLPGVASYDPSQLIGAPEISQTYARSLSELVLFQDYGVTHFYGSQLDLEDGMNVWMSPVEVDDGKQFSYFQILYVNTTPLEALNDPDLPVSLLEVDEASYKLTPADHPGYQQLMSQFTSGRKHVLVRHCNTGMAYYPRSITPPLPGEERPQSHLEKVITATGLHEPEVQVTLVKPSEEEEPRIETTAIQTIHTRKYPFAGGEVHSYGLVLDNDPWQYYEIFTPGEIEQMRGKDLLIRIDSGCDIGQIYDDKGCDCREQLHTALTAIQEEGAGAVIHIPAQDGRGYGAATKMETEGIKRGIKVATNGDNPCPVDTITAAESVLGANFDIRTYNGVGRVLGSLGVKSVRLQTDNRLKAEGLRASGIRILRKPTGTKGANGSSHHVEAKHRHSQIYYGEDE